MSDQPNVPSNIGTFIQNVLSVVKKQVNGKQDVVKGLPGQVVGFDADGNMQAQDFDGGGGGPITSGVSSFNGRSGAVLPKEGDYTAEMVCADPSGAAQTAADTLKTEVECKLTEQDEKLAAVEQGLDDKISSSGGTMQAALVFAKPSVARSAGESGSVSMQEDGLTITSGTGVVKLVDEVDGQNAVLSGVDFAVNSNEAVPLQQMQETIPVKIAEYNKNHPVVYSTIVGKPEPLTNKQLEEMLT